MLYIAENIKAFRKSKDMTQEDVAELLGVSPQSVSKWERGDTFPDITLLPSLANLYNTSVDAIIGMDRINEKQTLNTIFGTGHKHLRDGDTGLAIEVYSEALKMFPNNEAIMSDLAMSLALDGDPEKLARAVAICERMLSAGPGDKVHHTTRAALCFIYLKAGEKDNAFATAKSLPHIRESREAILKFFERIPDTDDIDAYLRFIAIGEIDKQDVVEIDFGIDMVDLCTQHRLLEKIESLRNEIDAPTCIEGHNILPPIRIRDKVDLEPARLRVRYYADYLIDKEYTNIGQAADEIIEALRGIADKNKNSKK